jgi:hypothetical protein
MPGIKKKLKIVGTYLKIMAKYTREQLIFYLKKLSDELKKTPTIKDMNKSSYPSSTTYSKRFATWNNALKAAGLKINVKKSFEKKELIENLKILAKELARSPRPKDLKGKKWAGSYATYRKAFRSWKNALREADLSDSGHTNLKNYTKRK